MAAYGALQGNIKVSLGVPLKEQEVVLNKVAIVANCSANLGDTLGAASDGQLFHIAVVRKACETDSEYGDRADDDELPPLRPRDMRRKPYPQSQRKRCAANRIRNKVKRRIATPPRRIAIGSKPVAGNIASPEPDSPATDLDPLADSNHELIDDLRFQ